MIDDLEQFSRWQDRTEARLATLESVSDEHVDKINGQTGALVSMDRDIGAIQAGFRKQEGLLQALHLTQNEHTAALRDLRSGQDELRSGQDKLRGGQEELRGGQEELRAGIKTIIGLLETITRNDS